MARIVVIEDETVLARSIRRALERQGHTVEVAGGVSSGERLIAEYGADLVLLDLRLPDGSGLDLLARLRGDSPSVAVIMMTAYASVGDAVRAIKLGARDYLQKPLHLDDLRHAVERALRENRLEVEVSYYRQREGREAGLASLRGDCPEMRELRGRIERLAALPSGAVPPTVLITGETGTGKGLVARTLHYTGSRREGPFIEVNCAAIPENLVEAELFGHEKGAFTDARTARPGLVETANHGTLFLDEIGCLPPGLQVKLLKVIEDKEVRPVGGRAGRRVDVQIVAATNADLDQMVKRGAFREDLYYRLRVAPLHVPPLRDRGDDVVMLAKAFLAELCANYRMPPRRLSPAAVAALRAHSWPGNVRELRNTLDRAVLFADGEEIDVAALGLPGGGTKTPMRVPPGQWAIELPEEGIRFEELERSLILAALEKAGGRPTQAARLLGMTRDTLRYRMEKFGIRGSRESRELDPERE